MKPRILLGLAAAALAFVAIAPPGAAAKTKRAKFKLSLRGEQTQAWSEDYVGEALYPSHEPYSCHYEGSEHVSFATPHPLKATVKTVRAPAGDHLLWFSLGPGGLNGWGDAALKVRADVERRLGSRGSARCFSADAYNCTRSAQGVEWWLLLSGEPDPNPDPNRIWLFDDVTRNQPDPFPDRPGSTGFLHGAFPDMALTYDPLIWGGEVTGKVSRRKLFDRDRKRIAIPVSGEETYSREPPLYDYSVNATANVSSTVSLKRIAKK